MPNKLLDVSLSNLKLDPENPRHEPIDDEEEIIQFLCDEDKLYELAKHIAQQRGLNPLVTPGVIMAENSGKDAIPIYKVVDGNRRVAAIKTLRDPQLAPASMRKRFKKLSENFSAPDSLLVAVFENEKQAKIWRDNLHSGAGDGEGPRTWRSDQKDRATGTNRHVEAQQLFDIGKRFGIVTKDELDKKLTTASRFATNSSFRDTLRIDNSDKSDLKTLIHPEDFVACLRLFLRDLVEETFDIGNGKQGSRYKSPEVRAYAFKLSKRAKVENRLLSRPVRLRDIKPAGNDAPEAPQNSNTVGGSSSPGGGESDRGPFDAPPESGNPIQPADQAGENGKRVSGTSAPTPLPSKPQKVESDEELVGALVRLGNQKVVDLYRSLCELNAKQHPFAAWLLAWCLLETLSAELGRTENSDFSKYFNGAQFKSLPNSKSIQRKDISLAIKRVQEEGNATKHSSVAASHDYAQLINTMKTLSGFVSDAINRVVEERS